MESLLQALPQELLSKIMLYTLKSPHTELECGVLKHAMGAPIYNKLVNKEGIVKDKNGHVVKVDASSVPWSERKRVKFDIAVLESLPKLTEFYLQWTGVFGDISVLESLPNMTRFYLFDTGVTGDIQVLQGLRNLTSLWCGSTGVFGDIQVFQELPNLTFFTLRSTRVTGDKEVFYDYRKSHGLKECRVSM